MISSIMLIATLAQSPQQCQPTQGVLYAQDLRKYLTQDQFATSVGRETFLNDICGYVGITCSSMREVDHAPLMVHFQQFHETYPLLVGGVSVQLGTQPTSDSMSYSVAPEQCFDARITRSAAAAEKLAEKKLGLEDVACTAGKLAYHRPETSAASDQFRLFYTVSCGQQADIVLRYLAFIAASGAPDTIMVDRVSD